MSSEESSFTSEKHQHKDKILIQLKTPKFVFKKVLDNDVAVDDDDCFCDNMSLLL